MTNSADIDQLASSEANWSGYTLFDKAGHIRVQQDQGSLESPSYIYFCYKINWFWQQLRNKQILPFSNVDKVVNENQSKQWKVHFNLFITWFIITRVWI